MALNNVGDLITAVLVRNNLTTTDSFITDTYLQGWVKDGHIWAAAQTEWPMTEGRISTTYTTTEEWNFEGYKADSFDYLTIGNDLFQKINFRDYLQMKDDTPSNTDKVYTDRGRTIFINVNSGSSGTLVAYGQYQPALDVTDLTAKTIFSDWDDEGNEAIVEKMSSYLKRRLHLPEEAELHDQRASAKLAEVAGRINKEKSNYQVRNGDGMFARFDAVEGGFNKDLFKRDQFN